MSLRHRRVERRRWLPLELLLLAPPLPLRVAAEVGRDLAHPRVEVDRRAPDAARGDPARLDLSERVAADDRYRAVDRSIEGRAAGRPGGAGVPQWPTRSR